MRFRLGVDAEFFPIQAGNQLIHFFLLLAIAKAGQPVNPSNDRSWIGNLFLRIDFFEIHPNLVLDGLKSKR